MLWMVPLAALLLLAVFLSARLRPRAAQPSRNAPLEEALPGYLRTLAARPQRRRAAWLRFPGRLERQLVTSLRLLSQLPPEELLPASRRLNDHGRMLQEQAAALRTGLARSCALPATEEGETRLGCFARALVSHTNAGLTQERLTQAVEAWQQQSPFSVRELELLPQALAHALLSLLAELAMQCADRQRTVQAAQATLAALEGQQEKLARRLFEKNRHHSLYLSRLLSGLRKAPEGDAALWSRQLPLLNELSAGQLTDEERTHQTETVSWAGNAIASLRAMEHLPWDRLTEEWDQCHQLFMQDETYRQMDRESRAAYRLRAGEMSRLGRRSQRAVCEAVLSLAEGYEAGDVRSHIGYYLLDEGVETLLGALGLQKDLRLRFRLGIRLAGLYRLTIRAAVPVAAALIVLWGGHWLAALPVSVLMAAALSRALKQLLCRIVLPRPVPRIQLDAIPEDARTLVVCPVMLLDPSHAVKAVRQMSIQQKANPDPNLHFLLLGDFRDSMAGSLMNDEETVAAAAAAIRALAEATGHPFFYLQRERVYHRPDHVHMSRERKRGGLETLMKLMEGQPVEDSFAYASLPPEKLAGRYRYLITLDSDTIMPPGAALRLAGAMLHPLVRRRSSAEGLRGLSVLQPRMEHAPRAATSLFACLMNDPGGLGPYNHLQSSFEQDVLGGGSFQGKGIIDPKAFLSATRGQIIPGAVLSHDLLEGLLGGAQQASDIVFFERQPDTLPQYLNRLHRWTRGDWQLLPYLLPLQRLRPEKNALLRADRQRIRQALGASLLSGVQLAAPVISILMGQPVLLLLSLLLPVLPLPGDGLRGLLRFAVQLLLLPPKAFTQLDAIGRTLYRLLVSRRHLLEWTTAAELAHKPTVPDLRYFYMSMAASGGLALLCLLPGALRLPGVLLAAVFAACPFLMPLTEKPLQPALRPTGYMREVLLRLAKSTLLFFETAITPEDHGLPPDNVQIEPNKGISHRTSPTNIGLYLCALISAQRLRLLTPDELAQRTRAALETMEALPKWNGHLYNWYDTRTLDALKPAFVSTVDSGNLAVCLLTAAQGLRCLLGELHPCDHDLPERLDALAAAMRFAPLYDPEAELFRIGVDTDTGEPAEAHYDLLASECRLASFYAVMTGQVPLRHWHRLGRTRVHTDRGQTLLSGSGTMFEYLMPFLFQPPMQGTLLTDAASHVIHLQKTRKQQGVWGISESGYYAFDPHLYYQYKAFGIDRLALDPNAEDSVIAPYATLLAMPLAPKEAFRNLLSLQSLGLEGPLGMFEAADFAPERIGGGQTMRLVHSHMAHHQGMILCAICNFLCDHALAGLFYRLPGVQAYRLLLEEPMHRLRGVLRKPLRRVSRSVQKPPMFASHPAQGLRFPMEVKLLHGAGTTLAVSACGGGYMSKNGIMLTRFEESCHLPSGLRLYLKDSQTGQFWQTAAPGAEVVFETAQAIFTLSRTDITSELRIFVDPLSGAAVHALTLENHSRAQRMLEVCSYLEPALFPRQDFQAHPAYRKLFLETEKLGSYGVSLRRRPAAPEDAGLLLWHTLSTDTAMSVFHIQTNRSAFLGRGRTVYSPRELELPLSGLADSLGAAADPCISLRGQFVLQPEGRARFIFITHQPGMRESASSFLLRCDRPEDALGWYDAALTQALVTAQTLEVAPDMQQLFAPLCGLICYTGQPSQMRWADHNALPLSGLETMGLEPSLPLLVWEVSDRDGLADAELLLRLHAFCRMSGLWFCLVLLTDGDAALHRRLLDLAERSHSRDLLSKPEGIHVFAPGAADDAHRSLLFAAARLALRSGDGSLSDQLAGMQRSSQTRPVYRQKSPSAWRLMLPAIEELTLCNGYGGFTKEEGNYVITLPPGRQTPAPWCNPLCNEHFGQLAGESGLLFSYAENSGTGRLTRWPNDAVSPVGEESFFLRDEGHRLLWSLTRQPLGMGLAVRITHAPGETVYESSGYGIYSRMHCFADPEEPLGIRVIHLKNEDSTERILTFCHSLLYTPDPSAASPQLCHAGRIGGGLTLETPQRDGVLGICGVEQEPSIQSIMSAGAFQGLWGVAPAALSGAELPASEGGNTALLCTTVQLKPGESRTLVCAIGYAKKRSILNRMLQQLRTGGATRRLHRCKQQWEHRLSAMRFDLPDEGLCLLMNRWLPYQVRSARLMMRAGLYQAGGGIGFRDQLQDVQALFYTEPERAREQILACAAHQFTEGDVQHWWHPERFGVRTRCSDDRLFLPYLTALYVHATGDEAILDVAVPFLAEEPLAEQEKERLCTPPQTQETAPLREHCLRAIRLVETGAHGLPLMGSGDWNDSLDRVEGESVWLGMFLCEALRLFAPLCPQAEAAHMEQQRQELLRHIERFAWDGGWYLRGWYRDGTPLGTQQAEECRIALLPQAWAVLCGASRDRCQLAMENAWRMLYEKNPGLIRLFTPPFDQDTRPGTICGYLPGIRENGGQYTHAVSWAIAALHQLGQEERAWELALAILPTHHAATQQLSLRYRTEPYVLAGDVYDHPRLRGQGGWTWYTGSAARYLTAVTEQLLGLRKSGAQLRFVPVLPKGWDEVRISYRYGNATYHLHASRSCTAAVADGQPLPGGVLLLKDDGRIHEAAFPVR